MPAGDREVMPKMSPRLRRFLQASTVVVLFAYTTVLAYQSLSRAAYDAEVSAPERVRSELAVTWTRVVSIEIALGDIDTFTKLDSPQFQQHRDSKPNGSRAKRGSA